MVFYLIFPLTILFANLAVSKSTVCVSNCTADDDNTVCGFDPTKVEYTLFSSKCAFEAYQKCHSTEYQETPLTFCVKAQQQLATRRRYSESCPVFCPEHYRPVCAASTLRSYAYRAFINGCNLDMINCRGDQDMNYVEVPLKYCGNHLMKNIFHEKILYSGMAGNL